MSPLGLTSEGIGTTRRTSSLPSGKLKGPVQRGLPALPIVSLMHAFPDRLSAAARRLFHALTGAAVDAADPIARCAATPPPPCPNR
jgi:hypothetical protein